MKVETQDKSRNVTRKKGTSFSQSRAMLTNFALWIRLLVFPIFSKVRIDAEWRESISQRAQQGHIVYVVEVRSPLDFLLLNYLLLKHDLPLAKTNNGIQTYLFKPVWVLILGLFALPFSLYRMKKGRLTIAEAAASGYASLMFLKKGRLIVLSGGELAQSELVGLVSTQRLLNKPIFLIPQLIFWSKAPDRFHRSLLGLVLGDPNAPGLRRMLNFLFNASNILVKSGAAVNVRQVLEEESNRGKEDKEIAKKLSWLLHRNIDIEERTTRGPLLKGRRQICAEMLANPDFVTEVERIGQLQGLSSRKAIETARKYIREIGADVRGSYVEMMFFFLTHVFRKLFSSFVIDKESIKILRDAFTQGPVILVPSHRSHADYLLLSYILYIHGITPPHIAAGANLSFWPLGPIFRHSGAFFIRRVFKDNKLYAFVVAQYVRKLLKEGYPIEFFIEGGRSREGKTRPPKFGILKYITDAVTQGAIADAVIVPVALSYERIVEVESYARELAGAEKRAENVAQLVRSTKVLESRYGRLYFTVGRPIKVAQFLSMGGRQDAQVLSQQEQRDMVTKLGYLILGRINRAMVVTPSGIVATALLSHHRRGMSRDRLLKYVGFLAGFAKERGYELSITMERALLVHIREIARAKNANPNTWNGKELLREARGYALRTVVSEALDMFLAQNCLAIREVEGERIYSVLPDRRLVLNYYRNSVIHVFQREALISLALYARFLTESPVPIELIEQDGRLLSGLFKREFIYRIGNFKLGVKAALTALQQEGLVVVNGDNIYLEPRGFELLKLFRNMVLPLLESYYITAINLKIVRFQGALRKRELVSRILTKAQKEYHEGNITCLEALSSVSISNAVDYFISQGYLTIVESGIDQGKIRFARASAEDNIHRLAERLQFFLRGG